MLWNYLAFGWGGGGGGGVEEEVWSESVPSSLQLVSAPNPNQPQRGSLPVSHIMILEVIRSAVGLVWVWGRDYTSI